MYVNENQKPLGAVMRARGFSLIELMIVLGIVAIMASIAVPAFTRMIRANNVLAAANSFVADMTYTRTEAMNRGVRMSMCPTADVNASPASCLPFGSAWDNGWLIFPTDSGPTALIRVGTPGEGASISPGAEIIFNNRGLPNIPPTFYANAKECDEGIDKEIELRLSDGGQLFTKAQTAGAGRCP